MERVVELPPERELLEDGAKLGGWWHETDQPGRVICDLCPRACNLKPGDRGFCFVRENRAGEMVLTTYGRSTGFCVDPIEKKPLNHFYPGTSVLSFGTAGCNLGCKFCQNWDISKSRETARLSDYASPADIARAAERLGCRSVAFTYNDPVIWAEYAIDVARECRALGINTVAVTAGYITPQARRPFYDAMDAANVDLKAFTEEFYHHLTLSHLQPVLDTLVWLHEETDVWCEITNLIIPQANDSPDELRKMCDWILDHVGDVVPVHFTAFHPDFRMLDRPSTPPETLVQAYDIAREQGLKYVYVGNVHDAGRDSTFCHQCGKLLIERDWHQIGAYHMSNDCCGYCGTRIPGHFDASPGNWGRRRLPVRIGDYRAAEEQGSKSRARSEPNMATQETQSTAVTTQPAVAARPELTPQQQKGIHAEACRVVASAVHGVPLASDTELAGAAQTVVNGSFVTLTRRDRLRACCGFFGRPVTVWEALEHAARRTATEDTRLPPISPTELPHLELGVSLLFALVPVSARGSRRVGAIEVGRHGLQIRRGQLAGLLLPSVAVDHKLDAEAFLRQVCRKAGLPTTAWQESDTQLFTFETAVVKDSFDADILEGVPAERESLLSAAELAMLADHCRANVIAHVRGATPNYYLPDAMDGMVNGLYLDVRLPGADEPLRVGQMSLRPALPLQATLLNLAQNTGEALRARGFNAEAIDKIRLALSVLYDPAMHGTVAEPDVRGFDPGSRALLVSENNRSAWVFDPAAPAERLLDMARSEAQVSVPEYAQVHSLAACSTEPCVTLASVPRAQRGAVVRPPAVAGSFYPAEADQLSEVVDELLGGDAVPPESWHAAMVPHAGLRYSGHIAADVMRRIEFPETVIVIGPKHTRLGTEWAVAPHETWSLPGATMASDPELASRLAAAIPTLQLDAAAHQQEHAIEVELPLLARLAPNARIVGLAIGGGDLTRCRQFAQGLAAVMAEITPRPLLMISSDMNHFATDSENRRLDEMALVQLDRLDAEGLYRTCNEHNISMCGVLPAVIVLETLKQLNLLSTSHRVAYGTSADVSGDTSRVVGYAGMLFR